MPALIIVNVKEIRDAERYETYKKLTPPTIEKYGGRFVVRGGAAEVLEGEWQPGRLVVIEFPSVEAAKDWASSDDYAPAKQLRNSIADADLVVVETL